MSSPLAQKQLDLTIFKDTTQRDKEFVESHTEHWGHGMTDVYALMTYTPNLSLRSPLATKHLREIHFKPRISFSRLESYMSIPPEIYYTGKYAQELENMSAEQAEPFRSDEHTLPFSGLLNIPAFSFCTGGAIVPKRKPALFCYHTHFEVGEITYMFGGLRCDPEFSLKVLGIPMDTKLSQISVHLPQDLPPYVNKDIFLSPLMVYNYSFITFNPTRGTVHEYPLASMQEQGPSQICDMNGTRITETQVFFCGGFHVKIDGVTYKPELDRWIIEKRIEMNTDGYILDTIKLTFTKIEIVAKLEMTFYGRVGATLCSSFFCCSSTCDDTSSLNSALDSQPIKELSAAENNLLSESRQTPIPTKPTSLNSTNVATSPITITLTSAKTSDNISVSRSTTNSSTKTQGRPTIITSPASLTKKSSLLSKSSRLFHRNLTKQSNSSNQSSVYSSYSNQVKQHRSQNLPVCQSDSRPASPQYPLKLNGPKLGIDTNIDLKDSELKRTYGSPTMTLQSLSEVPNSDLRARVSSPAPSAASDGESTSIPGDSSKTELVSVCVYMFGGFHLADDEITGIKHFVASNRLLKIELLLDDASQCRFHKEALMVRVPPKGDLVPLPRGYFAYFMADKECSFESCELFPLGMQDTSDSESLKLMESSFEAASLGQRSYAPHGKCCNGDFQLDSKTLIIQGGVDDQLQVFGDFYSYSFSTGLWQKMSTYAFDYYNIPKAPHTDEHVEDLAYESQVANAEPKEAELRCCHHKAMTFNEDGKAHVIFCGGFGNDFLRHFDKTPYSSDLLDVLRLARLMLYTTNSNLLRLPVLSLSTQTWKFSRYFYDLREVMTSRAGEILTRESFMRNSRLTFVGGAFLIVGKQLTFCHGMAVFVPELTEEFEKMRREHGSCWFLLGGHFHLTFPGM